MQMRIKDIHDYYEVITKVWGFFRKFYENYDADGVLQEVEDFEKWAKYQGPRIYEFGMQLIRIAWKEVGELHEMRRKNEQENQG